MTAREYCKSHPVTAYDSSYGRCGGFQIHGDIEYGITITFMVCLVRYVKMRNIIVTIT